MFKFRLNINQLTVFFAFCVMIVFSSCSDDSPTSGNDWSSIKIAVFSDPHVFDPSLGISGEAFNTYTSNDRKMLAESYAISESIVNSLITENPDIVLVPGDLTKDGELKSHQTFATLLKKLTDKGIKVYVVPGNHDISNPGASSYNGANRIKTANINENDFATIYSEFGYSKTISRDPNSLSYVAEPKPGVWILGLDACRYRENTTGAITGGTLSTNTLNWIKSRLQEAKSQNKTVIGMMHHGIAEHFNGQSLIFSDYLVNDFQNISEQLAQAGLHVMFTGHFHANDISKKTFTNDFIFDIETGSSVTWSSPYRIINLSNDGVMDIKTKLVTQINYDLKGIDFQTYAKNYLQDGISPLVYSILKSQLQATDEQIAFASPYAIAAIMAHYAGDESADDATKAAIKQMQSTTSTRILGDALYSIWNDIPPNDNNVKINIKTGNIIPQ